MNPDLSNEREMGGLPDTGARLMMDGAQFDMMMAAHRRLFEQIEAINRAWLVIVQETSKSGSDLAVRLLQCKDPTEAQALCDAWLRDCATRFIAFSRCAMGSWMELQRAAIVSTPEQDVVREKKSERVPREQSPKDGNRSRSPAEPGKMGTRRAEPLAETASP